MADGLNTEEPTPMLVEDSQQEDHEEENLADSFSDSASVISGKSGKSPMLKLKHAGSIELKKGENLMEMSP